MADSPAKFLVYAKDDEIISVKAIKSFATKLPNNPTIIALKGNEHTIILGDDRQMIFEASLDFIKKQLK
jgi:hypothetical protein